MFGTTKYITLEAAKKMVAAGEAEARKNSWNVAITIVDANGDLGAAVFPAETDVSQARDVFHHVARIISHAPGIVEIMATDFQLQAAGLVVVVSPATAEEAHDLVIAA